jgi:hypothetical protein
VKIVKGRIFGKSIVPLSHIRLIENLVARITQANQLNLCNTLRIIAIPEKHPNGSKRSKPTEVELDNISGLYKAYVREYPIEYPTKYGQKYVTVPPF